jgi:hypothetical protein
MPGLPAEHHLRTRTPRDFETYGHDSWLRMTSFETLFAKKSHSIDSYRPLTLIGFVKEVSSSVEPRWNLAKILCAEGV